MPCPFPVEKRILAPSILAGDHAALAESLEQIEAAGVQWVHLDIMDGHFVPNLSFGPETVRALRKRSKDLYFDVHLMLDNPHEYIDAFIDAGADGVSIHVEPDYDIAGTLERIRKRGKKCGVVANPGTGIEALEPYLGEADLVLLMTVQPGFGGQSFREDVLPKMAALKALREERGLSFRIEVDGGVDLKTVEACKTHGADTFVAGTAFFRAEDRVAFRKAVEA